MMDHGSPLAGKVALVFGGSRGIGAAIVRQLAADGASVALTYANSPEKAAETAPAAKTQGGSVMTIKADSADSEPVRDAVAQTVSRVSRLAIVVVNRDFLIRGTVHTQ